MSGFQFVHHVATLMSGRIASQAIAILTVPIIARLFDPTDFGITTIFVTVTTILASVAPLRYFRAALLEKDDLRAHLLLILSFRCLLISCAVVFIFIVLLTILGLQMPFEGAENSWIWFVPAGMLFLGMGQILTSSLLRKKSYRSVALSDFANAFLTAGSRMLLGLLGSSVLGLILGFFIGAIGKWIIIKVSVARLVKKISVDVKWTELKALAIEYKDFPLYNMPTALLGGLSRNLPILLMGFMFEPAIIGFYAMADRLIRRPSSLIAKPIIDVFIVKGANLTKDRNNLKVVFTKLTLGLFVLGVIPFGVLGLFGEQLMDWFLGERWQGAGSFLEILAPWYFSAWVTIGVQPTMVVIRKQALWLRVQFWVLVLRGAVFGVAYLMVADAKLTLVWFTAVNVMISVSILCLTYYIMTRPQAVED